MVEWKSFDWRRLFSPLRREPRRVKTRMVVDFNAALAC